MWIVPRTDRVVTKGKQISMFTFRSSRTLSLYPSLIALSHPADNHDRIRGVSGWHSGRCMDSDSIGLWSEKGLATPVRPRVHVVVRGFGNRERLEMPVEAFRGDGIWN